MAQGIQWLQTQDPDRPSSFHFIHLGIRFPHVVIGKSMEETSRLRKLTSLTYLSGKLSSVFHREHRDTIVCEEDEEHPDCNRNMYDIIRHSEEYTAFDHLAKFSTNVSMPTKRYEPSKEQRWCTNCAKCFQRGLSRYDQYCGLDCKTAHRMRQMA